MPKCSNRDSPMKTMTASIFAGNDDRPRQQQQTQQVLSSRVSAKGCTPVRFPVYFPVPPCYFGRFPAFSLISLQIYGVPLFSPVINRRIALGPASTPTRFPQLRPGVAAVPFGAGLSHLSGNVKADSPCSPPPRAACFALRVWGGVGGGGAFFCF